MVQPMAPPASPPSSPRSPRSPFAPKHSSPGPLAPGRRLGSPPMKRAVSEVIGETFLSFDHRSRIVEPFEEEHKRDAEFQEKLNEMLLELMLEFHAWSTARPKHETEETADALEKEINAVMDVEREQGMSNTAAPARSLSVLERTRQRLNEFVNRIRMALAALTGLA